MAKKLKPRPTFPLRHVDDGFAYVCTREDSPEAFRQRMAARAAAAKLPTATVESIRRKRA
jgi:hypothetical protein